MGEPRRRREPDLDGEVAGLEAAVGRFVEFDPKAMRGRDVAGVLDAVERQIRVLEAYRRRLALRAEQANVHKRDDAGGSYRTSADWYAAKTGTTASAARKSLETARRLEDLPEVDDAARSGELSEEQTTVVARAGEVAPERQGELVETAKHSSLKSLNDECRSVIADASSADDEAARLAAQRRRAHLRTWNDLEGMFCGSFAFAPDDRSAVLKARLEAETDRLMRTAKRNSSNGDGGRRGYDWYAAQALAIIVTGDTPTAGTGGDTTAAGAGGLADAGGGSADATESAALDGAGEAGSGSRDAGARIDAGSASRSRGTKPRTRREVCINVDLQALRRGYRTSGERCEIAGLGSVPVEMASDLADDPFIKSVIKDGTEIRTVVHWGRHIPAEVRTALQNRDPTCSVPGCDHVFGLEYDHNTPHAEGGATSLDNLQPLCRYHHQLKTHHGYRLDGEPGRRRWRDPHGHTITQDPDPPPAQPPQHEPNRTPAEAGAGDDATLFD